MSKKQKQKKQSRRITGMEDFADANAELASDLMDDPTIRLGEKIDKFSKLNRNVMQLHGEQRKTVHDFKRAGLCLDEANLDALTIKLKKS